MNSELKKLVKDEADKLKQFATADELVKLDFDQLSPRDMTRCIYGQIAGVCFNERAVELLNKCAKPLIDDYGDYFDGIDLRLTERPERFDNHDERWFSPIEVYITQREANNENLIQYLRGEVEDLDL